jgi:hypothetical protein
MDSMNDAALDRDLERLLAVEPSPAFVAHVRTRIANEPLPSSRSFGWLFAGGATAVAAASVAIAMFVAAPPRQVTPVRARLDSRSIASASVAVPVLRPDPVGVDPRVRPVPTHASARTEVLFDERETRALQRLIAGVRAARVDLAPLLNEARMSPQPMDDLVIPPITIEPLAPSGVEGERP